VTTLTPAERLRHIISFTNNYIADTHAEASMFATIFIGILNLQNGTFTYMNCGHESPLWVRGDGSLSPLVRTGPAVGVIPGASFEVEEIAFERDDLLLAFTDGIPDALNSAGESFGKERLNKLTGTSTSPGLLLDTIERQLHQFIGNATQFDDITLLAVKKVL
jgi:sigma-B regulation protein RsbU (phosphoserine phosphatase)